MVATGNMIPDGESSFIRNAEIVVDDQSATSVGIPPKTSPAVGDVKRNVSATFSENPSGGGKDFRALLSAASRAISAAETEPADPKMGRDHFAVDGNGIVSIVGDDSESEADGGTGVLASNASPPPKSRTIGVGDGESAPDVEIRSPILDDAPTSKRRRFKSSCLLDAEIDLDFSAREARPYFPPYGSDPKQEENCVRKVVITRSTQTEAWDFPKRKRRKRSPRKSKVALFNNLSGPLPTSSMRMDRAPASRVFPKVQHCQTSKFFKTTGSQDGACTPNVLAYTPPTILPQRILISPFASPPLEHRASGFKRLQPQKTQIEAAPKPQAVSPSDASARRQQVELERSEFRRRTFLELISEVPCRLFSSSSNCAVPKTPVLSTSPKTMTADCARARQFNGFRKSRNWFSFLSHPYRSERFGQRSNACDIVKNTVAVTRDKKRLAALKPVSVAALSLTAQYECLRQNPVSIRLGKSRIHGVGVFANDDISVGQFVVEYKGEIIRNSLVERREKFYRGKGLGSYMFQIDLAFTIDGTMKGGMARFVNHSCDPNCSAKVIKCEDKKKHIVLIAAKKISKGDELSYDYKLPKEKDKIPCLCGSNMCRKFLN